MPKLNSKQKDKYIPPPIESQPVKQSWFKAISPMADDFKVASINGLNSLIEKEVSKANNHIEKDDFNKVVEKGKIAILTKIWDILNAARLLIEKARTSEIIDQAEAFNRISEMEEEEIRCESEVTKIESEIEMLKFWLSKANQKKKKKIIKEMREKSRIKDIELAEKIRQEKREKKNTNVLTNKLKSQYIQIEKQKATDIAKDELKEIQNKHAIKQADDQKILDEKQAELNKIKAYAEKEIADAKHSDELRRFKEKQEAEARAIEAKAKAESEATKIKVEAKAIEKKAEAEAIKEKAEAEATEEKAKAEAAKAKKEKAEAEAAEEKAKAEAAKAKKEKAEAENEQDEE